MRTRSLDMNARTASLNTYMQFSSFPFRSNRLPHPITYQPTKALNTIKQDKLQFITYTSFRSHYGPGVDSASNRNEYQEHFLGVKAAGA